jgi:transcriptional regulator with XRE-family HTH domain
MLALFVPKRASKITEDLSTYILRICNEKGITAQDIAKNAEKLGRTVARSHLSRIIGGGSGNPTVEVLRAIADGLGEPIEDVFRAALNIGNITRIKREIWLKQDLWDKFDEDAIRCKRTQEEHLAALLTAYLDIENVELGSLDGVKTELNEDADPPMSETDKPNSRKITRTLKDKGVDVDFKTVVRVLANDAPEVSIELKNKIFAAAGMPLIDTESNESNGKGSKKSNGSH